MALEKLREIELEEVQITIKSLNQGKSMLHVQLNSLINVQKRLLKVSETVTKKYSNAMKSCNSVKGYVKVAASKVASAAEQAQQLSSVNLELDKHISTLEKEISHERDSLWDEMASLEDQIKDLWQQFYKAQTFYMRKNLIQKKDNLIKETSIEKEQYVELEAAVAKLGNKYQRLTLNRDYLNKETEELLLQAIADAKEERRHVCDIQDELAEREAALIEELNCICLK